MEGAGTSRPLLFLTAHFKSVALYTRFETVLSA